MAADGFDPYYKWLGIPPEEQPPTHYRLLGVVQFEADRDVIANAATRQAFHLRQLQDGPQAALARRLLGEVAAAKATLLNPESRAQYDQTLAPDFGLPAEEIVPAPTFRKKKPAKVKGFDLTPLLVRVVPAVVIAGLLAFLLRGSDQQNVPQPDPVATADPQSEPSDTASNVRPSPAPVSPPAEHPVVASNNDNRPADRPVVAPADDDPVAMDPDVKESAGVEPPTTVAAMRDTPGGVVASDSMLASEMETESAPEIDSSKEPVPSEDDQAKGSKLVRTQYKADFAKAKTAELKVALAKKLLAEARDTDDDLMGQYALLTASIDLAAAASNFQLAVDGWNELGEHFQIDTLASQWTLFEKSAKTKQVEPLKTVLERFVEEAIDQDRYDLARGALKELVALSKGDDAEPYETDLKNLDVLVAKYREAKSALKTLETNAADPQANEKAGEFLSFFKLDWSRGLLLLSRSDNAALKDLARDELAQPDDPKKQVALADAWWNFGDGQSDEKIKKATRGRARFWYMLALPELTGDAREKAEKRATLEARAHRQSVAETKLTPQVLASKFQGKASYDAESNELTIVYGFQDAAELKDFEGEAQLTDGEIEVPQEQSIRHVVKFKTLKMTGVVTMKSKTGDVVRSSGGMQAQRDGVTVKISSAADSVSSSANGPADDDLVLPLELDANDKLVLFRLGDELVGKPMAKSEPGQVQLCGGEAGAQFSKLVISGQPDAAWMTEFFELPKDRGEKKSSSASSSTSKTVAKSKPAMKFGHIAQVVLWNEHNSSHNNSGTRTCDLILSRNGKSVWQKKDLEVPWEPNQPTKLVVEVPQILADSVRVKITAWHGESGGLSEVEVLDKADKNLAKDGRVFVSAEHLPGDPRNGSTLIDGITDSRNEKDGYWLAQNEQQGWADIRLLPQAAPTPAAPAKTSVATSKEPAKATGKPSRKSLDAKIFACCDDAFELNVNGVPALAGNGKEAVNAGTALKSGDVITVKATNDKGDVGFCCVIKFSNGQMFTTSDGWQSYIPGNFTQWSKPQQIAGVGPVVPGNSEWPAGLVKNASKMDAAQIWAPGGEPVCYLSYVVGKIDIPKKPVAK